MCMNKIELLKKIKYLNIELEGFDENNYIYWCEDLYYEIYIMKEVENYFKLEEMKNI